MTPNLAALHVLMDPRLSDAARARTLKALSKKASNRLANRAPCPECNAQGPHEDNGGSTLACAKCGTHFDP